MLIGSVSANNILEVLLRRNLNHCFVFVEENQTVVPAVLYNHTGWNTSRNIKESISFFYNLPQAFKSLII
jgi:hypothetical protein